MTGAGGAFFGPLGAGCFFFGGFFLRAFLAGAFLCAADDRLAASAWQAQPSRATKATMGTSTRVARFRNSDDIDRG